MHVNEMLIRNFYEAFDRKDYSVMQGSYHPAAVFTDPVFGDLTAAQVKAMWKMLALSATDLSIRFDGVRAGDDAGECRWEAWYTYPATGRRVHNVITATFRFRDGKIIAHRDRFDFWRWARMALGTPGLLLGWTPYLSRVVRKKARGNLERSMGKREPAV